MWIIRFHKLQTKDYNYINRKLKKCGFYSRKHSPILFIKAISYNIIEKKSWRNISQKIGINHIILYKFYTNHIKTLEINEIFHYLIDTRIIAFIGEKKSFNLEEIDNTTNFLQLTKKELESIFKSLK
ncbi:MAG: hypothetical protein PHN31_03460 [Candidatus Gracilibacteria bacterium]|nr:hypothetical protein [Candidatus Gracilibacteria bacterium]